VRRDVFASDADAKEQRESGKPSPKHGRGAVVAQWVRCGRRWCRCSNGGPRHGPYFLQIWREGGRRHKRYVRQADAEAVAAVCADRRATEREQRARADEARRAWRDVLALIREVERGER